MGFFVEGSSPYEANPFVRALSTTATTTKAPRACEPGGGGLFLPLSFIKESENASSKESRQLPYLFILLWMFSGIAIIADIFMAGIERITSKKKTTKVNGKALTYKVWNETVSNLTLMALGSSAPEILLSIIELCLSNNMIAGPLGPGTIVGSAAFNLFVIAAICVVSVGGRGSGGKADGSAKVVPALSAFENSGTSTPPARTNIPVIGSEIRIEDSILPDSALTAESEYAGQAAILEAGPEVKKVRDFDVFMVTSVFSIFAYLWLYFILELSSKDIVDPWEAIASLFYFPLLVWIAYRADVGKFPFGGNKERSMARSKNKLYDIENMNHSQIEALIVSIQAKYGNKITPGEIIDFIQGRDDEHEGMSKAAVKLKKIRKRNTFAYTNIAESIMQDKKDEALSEDKMLLTNVCGFLGCQRYIVNESCPSILVNVQRTNGDGKVMVDYETKDGTAKGGRSKKDPGADFIHTKGTLTFAPGETLKDIELNIIDDDEPEDDEDFTVHLSNIRSEKVDEPFKIFRGIAAVTIIDDDSPGTIQFAEEIIDLEDKPDEQSVTIKVTRVEGSSGIVKCRYQTEDDTAISGKDFEAASGILVFNPGQTEALIVIYVYPKNKKAKEKKKETFRIILSECRGGAKFSNTTDGGDESAICTVNLVNQDAGYRYGHLARVLSMNWDNIEAGNEAWRMQFRAAFYTDGTPEGHRKANILEKLFHWIQFPWKLLFSTVPPVNYNRGWPTFGLALMYIGILTAYVGDQAMLFGCALDIPDGITAITIVALGTSLPDAFASQYAAKEGKFADAAVGNITGSNSVNVFLGLGLPWTIAALYWQNTGINQTWLEDNDENVRNKFPGGGFLVPAGDLGYSVGVFIGGAFLCLGTLILRRIVFGGELGGPFVWKWLTALLFVTTWGGYVILSSLQMLKSMDK